MSNPNCGNPTCGTSVGCAFSGSWYLPHWNCPRLFGQQINVPEVTYFENVRWADTNMVMSLASAATWLRVEPAIISYADIFYRSTVVRDLGASNGELVVAYDRNWRALWSQGLLIR